MEYIKKSSEHTKYLKGSSVVEMSYIIPMFLGLFVLILHAVFYYHDKAVLIGAASETAILGAQAARREGTEYDLESFFSERLEGKLIYMTYVSVDVKNDETQIVVSASAHRGIMKLSVCQRAAISRPEEKLRMMTEVR